MFIVPIVVLDMCLLYSYLRHSSSSVFYFFILWVTCASLHPTNIYLVVSWYFLAFAFVLLLFFIFFVFRLSLEVCRCSSDLFLSSRPRPGLATANGDREIFIFPFQLTSSRFGNLTRFIHTPAVCVTMTYILDYGVYGCGPIG